MHSTPCASQRGPRLGVAEARHADHALARRRALGHARQRRAHLAADAEHDDVAVDARQVGHQARRGLAHEGLRALRRPRSVCGSIAHATADAFETVAAQRQRAHLGIGDRALEHPEAAVRVDVAHAPCAQHLLGAFDGARHLVGAFHVGGLDVDHAQAEADLRLQVLERRQFLARAVRAFQHDVVGMQRVQVVHQLVPGALLHRLPAVVAEAQVHGRRARHRVEHAVDGRCGPLPFVGVARQVGLVDLHDVGVEVLHLLGQRVGNGMRHLRRVAVVLVDQRLGQHVRAGDGELEGARRQRLGPRAGQRQVQAAVADGADHRAGRAGAELHAAAWSGRRSGRRRRSAA